MTHAVRDFGVATGVLNVAEETMLLITCGVAKECSG